MHKIILVTGGYGFIGANFIAQAAQNADKIINIDNRTYAASNLAIQNLNHLKNVINYELNINDSDSVYSILQKYRPTLLVNFAAESHVDNSIASPQIFLETNFMGTFNLLNAVKKYHSTYPFSNILFHHISTDEVYGSLNLSDLETFVESTPYDPASPYSASKASSDLLVNAWSKTYGAEVLITNCSNNYGPYQHHEKLIPKIITNAVEGKPIPIYGNGLNVRDWLYVKDHVDALLLLQNSRNKYKRYNIGGNNEINNMDVVKIVLTEVAMKLGKRKEHLLSLVQFTEDRKGHDLRYGVSTERIFNEFGWVPKKEFLEGVRETIDWVMLNKGGFMK
jgi:dTDP-glucose 4,6-dehydratase